MDPLSVAASIIGITTAAGQISRLLKIFIDGAGQAPASARSILLEVSGIEACLHQLQGFLLGKEEAARSRKSLIMIEQIIVVFTDCVSIFSELEQVLESVQPGEHMRILDRLKWSSKESAISKLLLRLQSSKTSMNLMLNILTCTSTDRAEASMRELGSLVKKVLRANVNMAFRLGNLERMHPALAVSSICTSQDDLAISEESRTASRLTKKNYAFDDELETTTVYRKTAVKQVRFSETSTSSYGPSCFSGLSLCDVINVSAVALPISSRELWNHHRYGPDTAGSATAISLDAWYNPPSKRSAFIRTAYFNGQYTNQYSQSKSTGHLVFRRFAVSAPNAAPIFTEGATMPQGPKELEKIGEESPEDESRVELEGLGCSVQGPLSSPNNKCQTTREAIPVLGAHESFNLSDLLASASIDMTSGTRAAFPSTGIAIGEPPESLARTLLPSRCPPGKITTFNQQSLAAIRSAIHSEDTQYLSSPLHVWPAVRTLPQLPSPAFKSTSEISAARRCRPYKPVRNLTRSITCDEDKAAFPTRKWTKALADMGDTVSWKLGVLDKIYAIQY